MSANLDILLSRLNKVRKQGRGYIACCSAHPDKTPSLSVEMKDGKILLHCFAGCSSLEIVESVGLTMSDLFSESLPDRPNRKYIPNLDHEILVINLYQDMRKRNIPVSDLDHADVQKALIKVEGFIYG